MPESSTAQTMPVPIAVKAECAASALTVAIERVMSAWTWVSSQMRWIARGPR